MRLNAGGFSSVMIGRDKEVKTLKTYINMHQHCAVTGPRRYGKTTLITNLLNDIKADYFIVKIDVFSASSLRELSHIIIDETYKCFDITNFIRHTKGNILEAVKNFRISYEDVSLGYTASKEEDENELIRQAFGLPEALAKKHGRRMVVFFDEFGDIVKFGTDLIKKLRAEFQTHSNVTYIFAGSQSSVMNNIFLNKDTAFFNFCSVMELGKIQIDDAKTFISNFESSGIKPDKDSVNEICRLTQGHPYYLIKLLQESLLSAVLSDMNQIDIRCVIDACDKILQSSDAFFQDEWNKINSKKYKGLILREILNLPVLDDTTLGKVTPSYKSQLVRELMDESIIDRKKEAVDPFFQLWLSKLI